jgi:uncharacterized damage-inducible protein DinB
MTHHRLGRTKPLDALKRAPGRMAALIRRVPRRLGARRPARGSWAINEVMCHLADAEVALAFRLRKIASEPGSVVPAWDQERWAEGGRYRRTPAAEALETFARLREANLAYVARLRPAQRDQYGRHPAYGRISIRQALDHWAEHDLTHLEQMRAALSSLSSRA